MTKNKKFSVTISIILTLIMTLSAGFSSYAKSVDVNPIEPCYVNIRNASALLTKSGIELNAKASLKSDKSMSLKIVMELQKKKSGKFETIKTWSASKTGISLAMSEKRNINILCDYRLKVTFTAGNETKIVYRNPA